MRKKYTKPSVEAKFNLARTLKEANVSEKKIAEIVEREPSTVKLWLRYPDYEAYQKYYNDRALKYGKPKPIKLSSSKPDSEITLRDIVERLDRMEEILYKLDNQAIY